MNLILFNAATGRHPNSEGRMRDSESDVTTVDKVSRRSG